MMKERAYFRTSTRETADGLIENFRLNMLPANPAVRSEFGIIGEDDARLFDALRWVWDNGFLDRDGLLTIKGDGDAITRAVNVAANPYAPVAYETSRDVLRRLDEMSKAQSA